jgi:hypothetical protein
MTPPNLHVIGIDPGGTTGWARLTVPRESIYGRAPGEIIEWDFGQFYGPFEDQTHEIARLARETQSLDYKIGPALIVEGFDIMPSNPTTDQELLSPVVIAAQLQYAKYRGELSDARIVVQGRTMAMSTATDQRLKAWGLYHPGAEHARDATRHAITFIRRAKDKPELRDEAWNHD